MTEYEPRTMGSREFQHAYHKYVTQSEEEALWTAASITLRDDPAGVVVVHFPGLGYALMLRTAAETVMEMLPGTPNAPRIVTSGGKDSRSGSPSAESGAS